MQEISQDTSLGIISIEQDVFDKLAGYAASSCYGVVGMAARSKADGIIRLLKKEAMSRGIKVTIEEESLIIDLHIMVEYGVNIPAISKSIINRVTYFVENATGVKVKKVNVFIDGIRTEE
jgi:uncharacterized alkaline shock family protein YloU